MRLFPAVDQAAAHRVELQRDVVHGVEQGLALFGQDESAGVAVEKRRAEILFQRADLPADRGLAEAERFARMGERARFGRGLEYAQLVPIHGRPLRPPRHYASSADVVIPWANRDIAGARKRQNG